MSGRNAITFTKPDEPTFLKHFKLRAGYREGPSVDDKRRVLPSADSAQDDADKPEEQPTIVALRPGDLTEEEVNVIRSEEEAKKAEANSADEPEEESVSLDHARKQSQEGREYATIEEEAMKSNKDSKSIVFRKPGKRARLEDSELNAATGKLPEKRPKQVSSMEKVQNKCLLSFDDDDEES